MHLNETILCATAPGPSSSSVGTGTITLHDIQTGATLASFKQTSADKHSTAIIPTRNGQGGLICAAQSEKSLLHVYNFQKVRVDSVYVLVERPSLCSQDQISLKIVLPEKLSCIAVDSRGNYCAGGTAHGRIYLWEVSVIIVNFQEPRVLKKPSRLHQGSCSIHGRPTTDALTCYHSVGIALCCCLEVRILA